MAQPINIDDFDAYIRQGEPDKAERAYMWRTAIGLQDVVSSSTDSPHKYPTSTPQVQNVFTWVDSNIKRIVQVIGVREVSVKEIMNSLNLRDRKNVLNIYLNPAIEGGYIQMLYPHSPRHPRQRYLLTVKGLALLNRNKQ